MYFRAWEYVLNEGKDSYYVPFQPLKRYEGIMEGDLLNPVKFVSKKKREQIFQTDEYGFRNTPGLLKKPIKVVLAGTSFVGGAAATQDELISSELTSHYKINTYNYATLPLQHFYEDERFIRNQPQYVVTVANETEILAGSWVEKIVASTTTHKVQAWSSHEQWYTSQMDGPFQFTDLIKRMRRFSLTRHYVMKINKYVLNSLFSREYIVRLFGSGVIYQSSNDMLFFDHTYDPRDTQENRNLIAKEINVLKETKRLLGERGIVFVLAVIPSKSALYMELYRDLPYEKRAIAHLEKELAKADIIHLPLSREIVESVQKKDMPYYYDDDGHWNTNINMLVAERIAKLIRSNTDQ